MREKFAVRVNDGASMIGSRDCDRYRVSPTLNHFCRDDAGFVFGRRKREHRRPPRTLATALDPLGLNECHRLGDPDRRKRPALNGFETVSGNYPVRVDALRKTREVTHGDGRQHFVGQQLVQVPRCLAGERWEFLESLLFQDTRATDLV